MRRRFLAAMLIAVVLVGTAWWLFSGSDDGTQGMEWGGFSDTSGVVVVDALDESSMDRLVFFVLRGEPAKIDRVLDRAGFEAEPVAGVQDAFPPMKGFDLDHLTDLSTADEDWRNADGVLLHRRMLRGTNSRGESVIIVQVTRAA